MIITPTVDVEGAHGDSPWEQLVLGEIGAKENWGVFRLAKIFNDYNIQGTFFVDIYEHSLWGEDKVGEVCLKLTELKQDVQLHTHPSWRDDPHDSLKLRSLKKKYSYLPQNLDFMSKLSLDQQIELLNHGIEFIHKWTGDKPIAHRSGGYSINDFTIEALIEVGIKIDSSMNASHPNSKVTWANNTITYRKGIIEIPVTFMEIQFDLLKPLSRLPKYRKLFKTEIDSCTLGALKYFLDYGIESGAPILNLFMHSFSLIKKNLCYTKMEPNLVTEDRLRKFIEYALLNNSAEFLSMNQIQKNTSLLNFNGIDQIPTIVDNKHIINLATKKISNITNMFLNKCS